jgi:uncharacterized lipoprotein YddW (UPF0748 family)
MNFASLLVLPVFAAMNDLTPPPAPPPVEREFRAAWVATVDNIDFPSKRTLSTEQQKTELLAIVDKAANLNLNAIILQIRPACDSLYASDLEPWSEYLTGQQGRPPEPLYDPLQFAIEEAHKRGMELHAWFNPYRAKHFTAKAPLAPTHLQNTRPELVKTYGRHLWLDPGEPEVQEHSLRVILDVVKRYDLDGVHVDDYFYPYKERGSDGKILDFPDEPSWQKYKRQGGTKNRADWRRSNVDSFIQKMYRAVKSEKNWVKVGISPFGIYRPGFPAQIKGFDQYTELYADARKWLRQGWLDYWTPQLYWHVEPPAQSFPVLLNWWISQNVHKRHIWAGLYTSRTEDGSAKPYSLNEIPYQIRIARGMEGASGHAHFSMKWLMQNRAGLSDKLKAELYSQPALIPASPWLGSTPPASANVTIQTKEKAKEIALSLPEGSLPPWQWIVRIRAGMNWQTRILPGTVSTLTIPINASWVQISAVSRTGIEGQATLTKCD